MSDSARAKAAKERASRERCCTNTCAAVGLKYTGLMGVAEHKYLGSSRILGGLNELPDELVCSAWFGSFRLEMARIGPYALLRCLAVPRHCLRHRRLA